MDHVAEIVGHTEPGAALIVNGQSVPNVAPDGAFPALHRAARSGTTHDFNYRIESPGRDGDETGVHRGSEVRDPKKDPSAFALVVVSGDNS